MEKRAILPEIAPRVVVLQEVVEAATSVEKRAILLEIAPREVQVVAEEGGPVINVEKRATLPEIVPVVVVPGGGAVISVEKRVILPGTVHPVVITGINLCLDLIKGLHCQSKITCPGHVFFPLGPILVIFHLQIAFGQRMYSDLE